MSYQKSKGTLQFDPGQIAFKILYEDIDRYQQRKLSALLVTFFIAAIIIFSIIDKKYEVAFVCSIILIGVLIWFFSIDFNIRIKKIGTVLLPISIYPFKNKAIMVDRSGILPMTELKYPYLNPEEIEKSNELFQEVQSLIKKFTPILRTDKNREIQISSNRVYNHPLKVYGQEHELIYYLDALYNIFKNTKVNKVEQPFILPQMDWLPSLRSIPLNNKKGLVIEKISKDSIQNEINKIQGIVGEREKRNQSFFSETLVESLLKFIIYMAPRYHWIINHSIKEVKAKNLFKFMNYVSFYSFNFYCPKCNEDLLQKFYDRKKEFKGKTEEAPVNFPPNTKMFLVDTVEGIWECPLCHNITDKPITIHRLDDELFRKVYDKLYEENKENRLKIYYDIMNQKRSYIEKAETQFHSVIRENRAKKEQIKSKIRSVSAEVKADSEAVASLYTLMAKYERLTQERLSQFESEIAEIKRSIVYETQKDIAELDAIFREVQTDINQKLTEYANLERIEQKARDEIQNRQLKALEGLQSIESARGEREELFERSNWNPANWGYNIRRKFVKTFDGITGKDEVTTAKKLHKIGK